MMRLSVVIPAYNEVGRLEASLRVIVDYLDTKCDDWQLIVVDDGSTDRTQPPGRDARIVEANGASRFRQAVALGDPHTETILETLEQSFGQGARSTADEVE